MGEPYIVLEGYDSKAVDMDYDQYYYLYYTLPVLRNAECIVETGLGMGGSTRIFLEALSSLPIPKDRVLHTWDILDNEHSQAAVGKIRAMDFPARWVFHHGDSTQRDPGLVGRGGVTGERDDPFPEEAVIDVLYLDSDHAYSTVKAELERFGPHLRRDGHSLVWTHDSMPNIEHSSYTRENGRPSWTYTAVKEWGDAHGYRSLLYGYPQGITLLYQLPRPTLEF